MLNSFVHSERFTAGMLHRASLLFVGLETFTLELWLKFKRLSVGLVYEPASFIFKGGDRLHH